MVWKLALFVAMSVVGAATAGASTAATPGLHGHYVRITTPTTGSTVGSRLTVHGTVKPGNATVLVGYRKGSDEPTLGRTTARGGRWRVRVRVPRAAKVIVVLSVSGGEDSVRIERR